MFKKYLSLYKILVVAICFLANTSFVLAETQNVSGDVNININENNENDKFFNSFLDEEYKNNLNDNSQKEIDNKNNEILAKADTNNTKINKQTEIKTVKNEENNKQLQTVQKKENSTKVNNNKSNSTNNNTKKSSNTSKPATNKSNKANTNSNKKTIDTKNNKAAIKNKQVAVKTTTAATNNTEKNKNVSKTSSNNNSSNNKKQTNTTKTNSNLNNNKKQVNASKTTSNSNNKNKQLTNKTSSNNKATTVKKAANNNNVINKAAANKTKQPAVQNTKNKSSAVAKNNQTNETTNTAKNKQQITKSSTSQEKKNKNTKNTTNQKNNLKSTADLQKKEVENKTKNRDVKSSDKKNNNKENDQIKINELVANEEELPLKLHNLIDLALERNLKTKQAYLNIKMAEYDLIGAKANFYPNIRMDGSYSQSSGDRYVRSDGSKYTQKGVDGSVSMDYSIFAFGKYTFNKNAVEHYLESIKYQENKVIQDIIFDVVENYFTLLSLKAQREAALDNKNLSYETYKAASLKYKLGLVPLVDKLKANTAYSQKKLDTIKIENEIKKQKANLNIVLNLEPDYVLYVENPEIKVKEVNIDIDYFLNEAKTNRPDLKKLQEERKRKEQELKVAKTAFAPEVSLGANIGASKDMTSGSDRKAYNEKGISLNVNVPIFNGFSDVANVRKIQKEIEVLDLQIKELEKQISNEVWSCYQDFNTYQVAFISTVDLLKSAEENAKINLGMYKNGKASILEVLDAQSQLEEAKTEFVNAKYNWIIYRIKLLKTIGKMNLDNIINVKGF